MKTQRARRLLPPAVGACALAAIATFVFPASAMASPYTAYAPNGAGRTTYETSNNHYTIYDTKGDRRAVAVIFYRSNGVIEGFQSCHEGNGEDCPGDLPRSVTGPLYMRTGVGLGSNPTGYTYGTPVYIPNA